jgi:hypothetical protein
MRLFRQFQGEGRRIHLLRTRVNKADKEGRGCSRPRPFSLRANIAYWATRLAVARGSKPDLTHSEGLTWTSVN